MRNPVYLTPAATQCTNRAAVPSYEAYGGSIPLGYQRRLPRTSRIFRTALCPWAMLLEEPFRVMGTAARAEALNVSL